MNKLMYKIVGWILIVVGVIYAITNLFFSWGGPTAADRAYEFGFGLLYSVIILALSFFPGKYLLSIGTNKAKQNKLTNTSIILILIGVALIVIAFLAMLVMCPPPSICDGFGLTIVFYGVFPAGFLFVISVILLIVNKFKK